MTRVQTIDAAAFNTYQRKRYPKLVAFAPLVRLDAHGIVELPRYHASGTHVSFHPSRSGFVDGDAPLAWHDDDTVDRDAITRRALVDFAALQNPWELRAFLDRVAALAPRTVLEIGTSCGGLLFAIAQLAAPDAWIASVDLPERADTAEVAAAVPRVLAALVQPSQTAVILRERSTLRAVRDRLVAQLAGRQLDLLVLDADHTYGGVVADFAMYAPLVRPGGLVAIHDAVTRPENSGPGFEVGYFWDEQEGGELLVDPEGQPGLLHATSTPLTEPRTDRRAVAFGWGLLRR